MDVEHTQVAWLESHSFACFISTGETDRPMVWTPLYCTSVLQSVRTDLFIQLPLIQVEPQTQLLGAGVERAQA